MKYRLLIKKIHDTEINNLVQSLQSRGARHVSVCLQNSHIEFKFESESDIKDDVLNIIDISSKLIIFDYIWDEGD